MMCKQGGEGQGMADMEDSGIAYIREGCGQYNGTSRSLQQVWSTLYSFHYLFTKQIISSMRKQESERKIPIPQTPSPIKQRLHPIAALINNITKDQHNVLSTLDQKCSSLEYSLGAVEVLIAQLAQRVQRANEARQAETLGALKLKQSDFIMGELRASLAKQARKEERLLEELAAERRRCETLREENSKLQSKNAVTTQKANALQAAMRRKAELLQSSNAAIQKIRSQQQSDSRSRNKSLMNKQSLSAARSSEEYSELQSKIEELQREFSNEIQKLVARNNELMGEVKKSKDSNADAAAANKALRRELEELGRGKYQMEIKCRQDALQLGELEQAYAKLVEKSNNSQIMLHKQLQDYKVKQLQLRNEFKKDKKIIKGYLSALAEHMNASKYYFTATHLKDQVEELKKLHDKTNKKRLENVSRQLEYSQAELKKMKAKADELQLKVGQLEKVKPTPTSSRESEGDFQRTQRASENGSLLHNRSNDRSEQQRRSVEEKYKGKLQTLRKDLKAKQSKINDLQRMQQVDFDRNKQRILELELLISEKTNDLRKQELKFKERDYEFAEYQAKIKELQARVKFVTEKLQGEKEASSKLVQVKSQSYEEKLRLVKANYKQLQKKDQEKTIKYNKLKSKYQKYQLEASQSLKRKNAQIDQLLKENNKLKAEGKLLEEKISINTIIETELSKNKTPNVSVNQDLIEQIEMERDRISSQLADKQRKCQQLAENNEKLCAQVAGLRREGRELRSKLQEMVREERFLREENKYAKQKLQELAKINAEQEQSKHNLLKKQLEKSVINVKKLQKTCEKYAADRQQRKKQLQQKGKQIQTLKGNLQKLKEKRSRLQSELHEERESRKRLVIDYQRRLSECSAKEQQLVDIINYKNRESSEGGEMRESMKGEELIIQQQAKLKFNMDIQTDRLITSQKAINTDPIDHYESHLTHERAIIPSELMLDNEYDFNILQKSGKHQQKEHVAQQPKVVNYFEDLVMAENQEECFDICEQGEEEVLQRVSINVQLKETFNVLRQAIEKVFNQQDISVTTVKQLPKQLQDDFNDFISYIKEKILQIQHENNLTFIMAEAGDQPEDIETQLHEFLAKPSNEFVQLRRIIQEKECMITSLMNQKTEQENTINDQQTLQEQAERLHLQQYSVLKHEIQEQKQALDRQQLYYESLRNILKKMMNFWIEDDDNYDDFEDNLQLVTTIYKFTPKEMDLMKLYLRKYRELKQLS